MGRSQIAFIIVPTLIVSTGWGSEEALDRLFPTDRVLDVQITVDEEEWNKIRYQTRDIRSALSEQRRTNAVESPYTYADAKLTIDGVDYSHVGVRKKGFIGSQSATRPSLKIKLDLYDEAQNIGGLTSLTFNNNRQDKTLMSQYLGYAFFNRVGCPAPRCAFAKITVNGENLGVYSHVETAREPLLERGFKNSKGTLYEGTVTDFFESWEDSFDRKLGKRKKGRAQIQQLISALENTQGEPLVSSLALTRAFIPTDDRLGTTWIESDFDDSDWIVGQGGAGFENQTGYEPHIHPTLDVKDSVAEKLTSVYLRTPFIINNLDEQVLAGNLLLRVKYDDGFVAYLNGFPIVSVNAPEETTWDSKATTPTSDDDAVRFEYFDLSPHLDKFREGKNLLAIHVLNIDESSTDMLLDAEIVSNDDDDEKAIGEWVSLKDFYRFWATESLLGFWDGYSGNRNNFFVYLNPKTDKFHFMPWGADCLFEKESRLGDHPRAPQSVKTNGLIAHRLYQTLAGRERYGRTLLALLDEHWDEEELLAEVERVEQLIKPHLSEPQELSLDLQPLRDFIRTRRNEIVQEIEEGMPVWGLEPEAPPAIPALVENEQSEPEVDPVQALLWNAARQGDTATLEQHLKEGLDPDTRDESGSTLLSATALGGHEKATLLLIESGADVDATNDDGNSALHNAAFLGRERVVRLLVAQGANVNVVNARGESPLDTATADWKSVQDFIEYVTDALRMKTSLKKIKLDREVVAMFLQSQGAKSASELP